MIVCHCQALSDRVIREAIARGAGCEELLAEDCGAGGHCGGCLPALRVLLDKHGRGGEGHRAPVSLPA
jgi:bacterioferritin-associated ferredoxin